jgi:hypothetical protein
VIVCIQLCVVDGRFTGLVPFLSFRQVIPSILWCWGAWLLPHCPTNTTHDEDLFQKAVGRSPRTQNRRWLVARVVPRLLLFALLLLLRLAGWLVRPPRAPSYRRRTPPSTCCLLMTLLLRGGRAVRLLVAGASK